MLDLTDLLCPEFPFRTGRDDSIVPGSFVMVGPNRGPVYEVVSMAADQAWVRPLANGQAGLVSLDRLRAVADPRAG